MRRPAALLVGVLVCLVGACAGDRGGGAAEPATTAIPSTVSTTTASPTSTTAATFACGLAAGSTDGTPDVGGTSRHYLLSVPAGLSAPVPLVLNMHGLDSDAAEQARYSRLPAAGAERGVVVVTPDGQGSPQHWNSLRVPGQADDYAFVDALLDELIASGCVDAHRVYSTGISNGSAMTAFLACRMGERFAAIGLVATTVHPMTCAADVRMPVIAFHGTDDPLVPYGGGTVATSNLAVRPAEQEIAAWATQNGCAAWPNTTSVAADVTELDFPGCPPGEAARLYRIEGGGHTWPGSIPVPRLGATTTSIDATALMLDFVAQFSR